MVRAEKKRFKLTDKTLNFDWRPPERAVKRLGRRDREPSPLIVEIGGDR